MIRYKKELNFEKGGEIMLNMPTDSFLFYIVLQVVQILAVLLIGVLWFLKKDDKK